MGKLCKLLDGRIMHVWSINEEDETVDVFPDSDYDIEVDIPETVEARNVAISNDENMTFDRTAC